jgi:hypothetical protein
MAATAFIVGFFTAFGFWTAGKITKEVDKIIDPPKIEQKQEEKK